MPLLCVCVPVLVCSCVWLFLFLSPSLSRALGQLSVAMMIGGALVAAIFDLQFEPKGYLLVATNDFCTAALGIAVKRALNLKIPQMRCVQSPLDSYNR